MLAKELLLVRTLAVFCSCSLGLFFIAASRWGQFAPASRLGYFGVYVTAAAVCLTASRAVRVPTLRWHWLSPAIISIPAAIVAARWNATISDLIALLFYPFAMLTSVRVSRPRFSAAGGHQSLDAIIVCGAALTTLLYVWLRGAPDSLYRLLAPAAAVSLVAPILLEVSRGHQRSAGLTFFFGGLLLAVLTDVTPLSMPYSAFTWAVAVWSMGVGAAVASTRYASRHDEAALPPLPTGWWSISAVAGVYAIIGIELRRIEFGDVRLLLGGATVLTAFVVVRQFIALRENDELIRARSAQEARFRALVHQSSDAFLVLDASGRLTFHSSALAGVTGAAEKDWVGSPFLDLMPVRARPTVAAMLSYVGESAGRSHRTVVSLARANDRANDVELIATNSTDDAAISGIVLTIRNITERIQFERQLAGQNRMDAVGRMASGVAHEFNNLLSVILGSVDSLSRSVDRSIAADELDDIRLAVMRAAELSRSLMTVSREQRVSESAIDVGALVRRVHRMLRSGMGPEYTIVLSVDPELWTAHAEALDLEHVLLNLALNARDAMPGGGTLTITATNVAAAQLPSPTSMPRQNYLRLTVEDSGVGMSQDVMARAFEPFFTTKDEARGTGLGLAFVYAAMRRSGGFVDLSSRVGIGTTFTLWLPRANPLAHERPTT